MSKDVKEKKRMVTVYSSPRKTTGGENIASYPTLPLKRKKTPDRNGLCPCGSGKKYKQCCLISGEFEKFLQ